MSKVLTDKILPTNVTQQQHGTGKIKGTRKLLTTVALLSSLIGCAHTPSITYDNLAAAEARQTRQAHLANQAETKSIIQSRKYYTVKITTHDDIELTATIYQPELRANETAPLLLHSHGFSMYRMKSPYSFYSLWMFAGQTAIEAWKSGYWVISYDQRGHGNSDGTINLLSPDHEIRDVSRIIDWAVDNLPHLAMKPATAKPAIAPETSPSLEIDTQQDNSTGLMHASYTQHHSERSAHQSHQALRGLTTPRLQPATLNPAAFSQLTPSKAIVERTEKKKAKRTLPPGTPDPLVGMIGESYMGSTQLMAASLDDRIDALVPLTTWFDLTDSLLPGEVAKSGWLTTLILSGNTLNPSSMSPELNYAYREIRQGHISDHFRQKLSDRSFKAFCRSSALPGADALIMQGFRDSLFTFNHGVEMRNCLREAGHDVRLIGTQGGHLLPLSQLRGLKTVYSFDRTVNCGQKKLNTRQMVMDWFDEKLRDKAGQADYIPPLCATLNEKQGVELTEFPIGGQVYPVERVSLKGSSGFWELGLRPLDWLKAAALPKRARFESKDFVNRQGGIRPAFVPLVPGGTHSYITGIPVIDLTLENLNPEITKPTVYVGIGIKHSDSEKIELLSDQVIPLSGVGRHQKALSAVSAALAPGDMLGLVVTGYSNQFRFSGSGFATHAAVSGTVQLPIQGDTPLLLTDIEPSSLPRNGLDAQN